MNYIAAAVMDVVIACTGLGLSLLLAQDPHFEIEHFYFWLSLLFAVVGIGTGLGSIYLSRLSDRFGRRPMLLIAVVGIMVSSLLIAVAGSWWVLFAIMAFRSLFMGAYWPSLEARITDGAEGPEMTRRLGLFGISFCVGLLLGHPFSGLLSDQWLRAPFYAAAGLCLGLLVLLAVAFRSDSAHDGHRPADCSAVDPREHVEAGRRLRPVFVLSAWIGNAVAYAIAGIFRGLFPRFATLPLAKDGLEFSGFKTGIVVAGINIAMILMFIVLGKFHFWHYRFRYLILGQLVSALGCLIFAICSGALVLFAAALLIGVGTGVVYISSMYYALDQQIARGVQTGLHEGVLCFGFGGGMVIMAVISRCVASHRAPYWVGMGMVLAGVLVQGVLWVRARRAVA